MSYGEIDMCFYSAPPQHYTPFSTPQPASQMSAEQIVSAIDSRDREVRANALEFLGRSIDRIVPRHKSLPTDPTIVCSCCGEERPRKFFRDHPGKFNQKQSQCRQCENRQRVKRYHDGKRRNMQIVVKNVTR